MSSPDKEDDLNKRITHNDFSHILEKFKDRRDLAIDIVPGDHVLIVGGTGSGKSTLLKKILLTRVNNIYDNIYYICNTAEEEQLDKLIKIKEENIHKQISEQLLSYIETLCKDSFLKKKETSLIIMDDIGTFRAANLNNIISRLRHYGTSCFILIQSPGFILPASREQCYHIFISNILNMRLLKSLVELLPQEVEFSNSVLKYAKTELPPKTFIYSTKSKPSRLFAYNSFKDELDEFEEDK